MARTINRMPIEVKYPSNKNVQSRYFNHYTWKGINDDKNFLEVDQETFQEAENVYVDSEGLLRSRPALKKKNITNISDIYDFWIFGDIKVYLVPSTNTGKYNLKFVKNDTLLVTSADFSSTEMKLVMYKQCIFVFTSTSFSYFDTSTNTFYFDGTSKIYVPVTKNITPNAETEMEAKNVLTNKEIWVYLYTTATGINPDVYGKTVKVDVLGITYEITFTQQTTDVLLEKFLIVTPEQQVKFGTGLIDTSAASKIYKKVMFDVSVNNSVVLFSYTSRYLMYSVDGKTFENYFVPFDVGTVMKCPAFSKDGTYIVIRTNLSYFLLSAIADTGTGTRRYPTFTDLRSIVTQANCPKLHSYLSITRDARQDVTMGNGDLSVFVTDDTFCICQADGLFYNQFFIVNAGLEKYRPISYYTENYAGDGEIELPYSVNQYIPYVTIDYDPTFVSEIDHSNNTQLATSTGLVTIHYNCTDKRYQDITRSIIWDLYIFDNCKTSAGTSYTESWSTTHYSGDSGVTDMIAAFECYFDGGYTLHDFSTNVNAAYACNTTCRIMAGYIYKTLWVNNEGYKYQVHKNTFGSYGNGDSDKFNVGKVHRSSSNTTYETTTVIGQSTFVAEVGDAVLLSFDCNKIACPYGVYDVTQNTFTRFLTNDNNVFTKYFIVAFGNYLYVDDDFSNQKNSNILVNDISTKLDVKYTHIPTGTQQDPIYNYLYPSHISELKTLYFAKDNVTYMSSDRKDANDQFQLYIPFQQTFNYEITALHPLSDTVMGVFMESEVDYLTYDNNVDSYIYQKSKLQIGLPKGNNVITSLDGTTLLFVIKRGLVALGYQDFIASTEQALTYLSDGIFQIFNDWNTSAIDLHLHGFWLICYKKSTGDCYIYDLRTKSWWHCSYPNHTSHKFVTDGTELLYLDSSKLYDLYTGDENYYDFDGVKKDTIDWKLSSQKLYLGAANYYKHIENITFNIAIDQAASRYGKEPTMNMQVCNYRKVRNIVNTENFAYNVDMIRTFVKRLNYFKVCEFQYQLSCDKDNVSQLPLSLADITVRYTIAGQVR